MTNEEFSNEFDTLVNSHSIEKPFEIASTLLEFNEYEKSVFLTEAQEQIVTELYSGRNNKSSSFEETEELRANLRVLIKTDKLIENSSNNKGLSKYSKFFTLPPDAMFITYEQAKIFDKSAGCKDGSEISVVPVTQDEFNRVVNNPFRQASKRRALRLDCGSNKVEIVSKYNIISYTIRYVARPTPIVLIDLPDGLTINEVSTETECILSSELHRPILERAVALALASRSIQNK